MSGEVLSFFSFCFAATYKSNEYETRPLLLELQEEKKNTKNLQKWTTKQRNKGPRPPQLEFEQKEKKEKDRKKRETINITHNRPHRSSSIFLCGVDRQPCFSLESNAPQATGKKAVSWQTTPVVLLWCPFRALKDGFSCAFFLGLLWLHIVMTVWNIFHQTEKWQFVLQTNGAALWLSIGSRSGIFCLNVTVKRVKGPHLPA